MWKILGKYLHYQLTKEITIFHPNITNPDRVTKSAWIIGVSKVYSESMMRGSRRFMNDNPHFFREGCRNSCFLLSFH